MEEGEGGWAGAEGVVEDVLGVERYETLIPCSHTSTTLLLGYLNYNICFFNLVFI